jgi:hypothetical protein
LGEGNGGQEIRQPLEAAWRQGQGHGGRIDEPPENGLAGGPVAVALEELFDRRGFPPVKTIRRVKGPKNSIDSGEEDATNAIESRSRPLGGRDEVVHKDVDGGQLATTRLVEVWITGRWRRKWAG